VAGKEADRGRTIVGRGERDSGAQGPAARVVDLAVTAANGTIPARYGVDIDARTSRGAVPFRSEAEKRPLAGLVATVDRRSSGAPLRARTPDPNSRATATRVRAAAPSVAATDQTRASSRTRLAGRAAVRAGPGATARAARPSASTARGSHARARRRVGTRGLVRRGAGDEKDGYQ
jgi:hypothetical protein